MVTKNQKHEINEILNEPLAIIGMNCQFPGVDADIEDVNAFYEMLLQGQTPIKEVPENRWNIEEYYDADRAKKDKIISRKGGFLNDPHLFDADFFKITHPEAKQIDPQHRLFLEVSIRALNHANITLESLSGSNTGVYCGISTYDYGQLNYKDQIEFNAYTPIGAVSSASVGRLSHFLNLKGPSLVVDTACSSSLSALYLAATALRTQQCPMAIVGGVHLSLCPENFIGVSKANMLSAKGQCSSFDSTADGYARSEGCGVIIVKRLSDALKDNNAIHAIIRSIVMNQDGDGTSLVAPNIKAQIAMNQAALDQANLTASDIDYIETHGTGTVLGDSVEFNAIQYVHQGHHSKDKPLIIGALKSNLGHTISSSGIASLIKAIAALKNETIPPNLHYSTPNESINPESIPALLPVKAVCFAKDAHKKRYAQVLNYGFIGTNVSTIIEEPPEFAQKKSRAEKDAPHCVVISACSEYSLKQMLANLVHYIKNSSASLRDICYTLINCRDHYKFRCAIIVKDKNELIKKIASEDYALKKVALKGHSTFRGLPGGSRNLATSLDPANKPREVGKGETVVNEADQIAEHYLEGANVRLEVNEAEYNKVDLPLYCFDRKPYWHQPRTTNQSLQNHAVNDLNAEPIAIIGMSCRFPKASNIAEFLSLLENGGSGMADIPLERWDNDKYFDADVEAPGRLYVKQMGFIDNVRNFDADFFNISPREAKFMCPQLRISLETSYHALEDANLPLDKIRGSSTGVFIGCGTNDYPVLLLTQGLTLEERNIFLATGNALSSVPGRIGYAFDFRGPTQAIDTACSSAMTAIHNACLSLQAGDCTMAIAGGVSVLLMPNSSITLSRAKMLSPESRCKTFSEDADGYARSEGCGMIVLKRLSAALQDDDTIHAVIKGSAVNSDGKSAGFTAPNSLAQEDVIRTALTRAQLSPANIDFIETHGTGTPLADPIEVKTLTKIFSESHSEENPLYISSVKTNIGHCEIAAGVAGLIKAVLSLQTKQLFQHINFKKLNPEIELINTIIPLSTMEWRKKRDLRCAGVSSFGFSGSNAHVVLQEVPAKGKVARMLPQECLLVLSAKSKAALDLLLSSYQQYLANTDDEFADICYTAATCRTHFLFRVAIKASTAQQAAAIIENKEYTIHQIKREDALIPQPLRLEKLQKAYQEGCIISWSDFYKSLDSQFKKVKLPLYEFVREEYWYGDKDKLIDEMVPKNWCYQLQWQQQSCDKNNRNIEGKNWLLIGGTQLAPGFKAKGLNIVLEEDDYPLDKLDGIIFAAGLDSILPTDIESHIDFQKKITKKLLSLVKDLNHQAIRLQLVVLTTNAIPELPVGKLNMGNGPLTGFSKTLALELPQFNTLLIDLDRVDNGLYAGQVFDEIKYNNGQDYEHVVAYRDGKRLVSRLINSTPIEKKRSLLGEGRYLITEGYSESGLVTAQALLASGAREVILTAKTVDTAAINAAIKKIQSIYTARIIRAVSVDLTDKKQVHGLFLDINADGLLKGIIHADGHAIKAPLIEQQDEDVDFLFSARIKSVWYLHELSQDCGLDFFVVYSSIASVFGSALESLFSATNSFFDLLIAERNRMGLVGTAIQWAPWLGAHIAQQEAGDEACITKEQAHLLIKRFINGQMNHVLIIPPEYINTMLGVITRPLPLFYKYLAVDSSAVDLPVNENLPPWVRDYLELGNDKRFDACKEMVHRICKKILELSEEDLDEDEGFYEIGFDSLMIVEMAFELQEKLKPLLTVTVNIGFDYPSINKLAKHIESELDAHLIKKPDSEMSPKNRDDSIAIIGMSCNLPNAPSIAAFERLLEEGLSGIKDIPIERWDNSKYYDPNRDAPGKSYVNKLGLIEHIKNFDAHFFGISPREAKMMEPQQRIFLECCYQALENANYHSESLRGSLTGVFAGVGPNEYFAQLEKSGFSNEELSMYSITGNVSNLIAGRVAYTFDFKGPAISVDTACSSSLVAIHYACQSLKNRETDYALAGGVNVLLMPESNITLSRAKALSPDGQCKTFDEQANGFVRSEGCGVIFLKRLSDALRDKDTILAVIKASAVNNDGKSAGLTVPNGKSQEDVMYKALSQTELTYSDIGFIEAHGTGTPLGDPIEVHAINKVYGEQRSKGNPLYLSAVKTNIGHLEAASGVAGIIKTVISLQKRKFIRS